MLSSDFFRGTDGFFRRSARLFTKKVLFRPKSHQRLFLRYRWILGRFPRERWIFPREKLAVLVDSCSFFSEQAMEIPASCDFHRLLGKKALSIACSEKVRGIGQHLRLFHSILLTLPRKNPALLRKKSGDSGDIF
jgi:hypothetical protein